MFIAINTVSPPLFLPTLPFAQSYKTGGVITSYILTHPICASMRPITSGNQDYHTRLEASRRSQEYKIHHELKNAPWDNTWGKLIRYEVPTAANARFLVGHTMGAPLGAIYRNDKHPFVKGNNRTFDYKERRGMLSPLQEFIQNDPLMRKLTLMPAICPERKALVEARQIQHIKTLQHLIDDKNNDFLDGDHSPQPC